MHERQTHNAELQRILQLCDDSEADLCWSHFDTLFDDNRSPKTTKQENKKADAFFKPNMPFPARVSPKLNDDALISLLFQLLFSFPFPVSLFFLLFPSYFSVWFYFSFPFLFSCFIFLFFSISCFTFLIFLQFLSLFILLFHFLLCFFLFSLFFPVFSVFLFFPCPFCCFRSHICCIHNSLTVTVTGTVTGVFSTAIVVRY